MKRSLPLLAILIVVGCTHPQATPPASTSAPAPSSPTAPPAVPMPCADDALNVTAGTVEEADTTRRVVVSFTNSSAQVCTLVGYPGADLVTAAGGVLVHVARRPANSAPHLELRPGDVATADVASSAVDTATGGACGRIGTLVVTAPNTTTAHLLAANLPICDATISAVG